MIDIYNIVKEQIFDKLDKTIKVKGLQAVNGKLKMFVCGSVKWARVGKSLRTNTTFGTDPTLYYFPIVSVDYVNNIIVLDYPKDAEGDPVNWTGNTGTLNDIYFFIGTPLRTNAEWLSFSNNEMLKTPFIWLVEPTREKKLGASSIIERESEIRLLLLDNNNSANWLTKNVHENRLGALYNLASEIENVANDNVKWFKEIETVDVKNYTRFGTETPQGFEANIIDADLTGVEMRFTLKVIKQAYCNC
jgi:hypothetical protein